MFFATDASENRRQRASFGQLLRSTGLVSPGDWFLSVHTSGQLYRWADHFHAPLYVEKGPLTSPSRSLDLVVEILENAGASTLSAGGSMSPAEVTSRLIAYHVNALTGDSSQIVQVVHHISSLPPAERAQIRLTKVVYTSEMLTAAQRALIRRVLGAVKICSIMASAEAGPYALSVPELTGAAEDDDEAPADCADFVFDTRATLIEILPLAVVSDGGGEACGGPASRHVEPLPNGERGAVVLTSLARLRNPVVRYVTGDVGSLHALPDDDGADHGHDLLPEAERRRLRVLRLRGRDRRFSFKWAGEYFEFDKIGALMDEAQCGILQWQVVLDKAEGSEESALEVRLRCCSRDAAGLISEKALAHRITTFFYVSLVNSHKFRIVFVDSLDGFARSSTGRKVIKFVDRFN